MRRPALLITAIVLLVAGLWGIRQLQQPRPQFAPSLNPTTSAEQAHAPAPTALQDPQGLPAFLPPEARQTVALIQRGGRFPHHQDGSVFSNRERHLPDRPRGYYREYTVDTPGARIRGARRIVTGGNPPEIWYYSEDHYETFKSFSVPGSTQ